MSVVLKAKPSAVHAKGRGSFKSTGNLNPRDFNSLFMLLRNVGQTIDMKRLPEHLTSVKLLKENQSTFHTEINGIEFHYYTFVKDRFSFSKEEIFDNII